MKTSSVLALLVLLLTVTISCSTTEIGDNHGTRFAPSEVIDLGALITEDLPERVWGRAQLTQFGFTEANSFDVLPWAFGDISGSNAYYTLFNHGGPHVDAPNHYGLGGGLDSYPVEAFSGPVKAFDARGYPPGPSIPAELFRHNVEAGDVVLIVTGYIPPVMDDAFPQVVTLMDEAAEFLATLPVRAYGTDGFSVGGPNETSTSGSHHSFLSRTIPVYEQLLNVEKLLGKQNLFFVGVPLNINQGDGMLVRPVVFIY